MFAPKNIAFRKSLFVPYQVPLKFGLSAKSITLPEPAPETIKDAEPLRLFSILFFLGYYLIIEV